MLFYKIILLLGYFYFLHFYIKSIEKLMFDLEPMFVFLILPLSQNFIFLELLINILYTIYFHTHGFQDSNYFIWLIELVSQINK